MVDQNDVIKELLTNQLETKVKRLENNHKPDFVEMKQEIVNTKKDNVEEESSIVVEELKGRNVTIVKTKVKTNPTKTVTTTENTDEENVVKKNRETTDKPKP